MVPTCYLRQMKFWVTHNRSQADQRTVQETKLQQWWYDSALEAKAHPMADELHRKEPEYGYGEWRDIPIGGE